MARGGDYGRIRLRPVTCCIRHYWVVFKLVLTVFGATILLLHAPTVRHAADRMFAGAPPPGGGGEVVHAAGGLVVLLVIVTLLVCKPRGLTPWGRRREPRPRNAAPARG